MELFRAAAQANQLKKGVDNVLTRKGRPSRDKDPREKIVGVRPL